MQNLGGISLYKLEDKNYLFSTYFDDIAALLQLLIANILGIKHDTDN